MSTFHSEVSYTYSPKKQELNNIAKESNLISADKYHEEDVIQGKYGSTGFYISEVHLEDEGENNTHTVFDGILLKINLPGSNFATFKDSI